MKWLIDMSIYTTITAAAILLIKSIFKNKMSAKWQYYIWIILLIRFIMPSLPQSNMSVFNSIPQINNIEVRQGPVESMPQLTQNHILGDIVINNSSVPFSIEKMIADYVVYIWTIGAVLLLLYFVFVYISFSNTVRKMEECEDNTVYTLLEECKNILSIKSKIKIRIGWDTPMLKGLFKPSIILPDGFTKEEIRNIFIHELCHYKYSDILVIWIATIILCINWFNPVIWYSFFIMRKDLELACDQRVLDVADDRKEYASLLLKTALRRNKFMLGTTCMQNGEKEISKRIKYIAYFKKPKVYWSIIILLAALVVGGLCLTNAISDKKVNNEENYAHTLLSYRTPYVGDASKVGGILTNLKLPKGVIRDGMELSTEKQPYGIIINYIVADDSEILKDGSIETTQFYKNSAVIFSLVDNVDNVYVNLKNEGASYQLPYTRKMMNYIFNGDVRNFTKDETAFKEFLIKVDNLKIEGKKQISNDPNSFNIYKADENLTYLYKAGSYFVEKESMTNELPNIIKKEYGIDVESMIMAGTTMVVDLAKSMESELDKGSANAAYKLSVLYKSLLERDNIRTVKVLIDGKEGVEGNHFSFKKPAVLESDGRTAVEKYFQMAPTLIPSIAYNYDKTNLEDVIKHEIIDKNANGYAQGEVKAEGHKILRTDNEDGHTKVYLVTSYGEYGFENGIFTKISGSGAIPNVLVFAKNGRGEYILEDYKIPVDGAGYVASIKKMFPLTLQKDALDSHRHYGELRTQEEVYAKEYLKVIGRNAVVQADHVEKILADMNVDASNKLLNMYGEYPYWIGTLEKLENGQRYVYEKVFISKSNGDGTVSFIKKKYNGETVEKAVIDINNGKMTYIEGQQRGEGYSKKI